MKPAAEINREVREHFQAAKRRVCVKAQWKKMLDKAFDRSFAEEFARLEASTWSGPRRLVTGTDSHTQWVDISSRNRLYELLVEAEYDTSLSKAVRGALARLRLAILDEVE